MFASSEFDNQGVSHALRTIEYKDRDAMYEWVQNNAPGCKKVVLVEFSKTQFSHTLLSKRNSPTCLRLGSCVSV